MNTDDDSHSDDGGHGKPKAKKSAIVIFLVLLRN